MLDTWPNDLNPYRRFNRNSENDRRFEANIRGEIKQEGFVFGRLTAYIWSREFCPASRPKEFTERIMQSTRSYRVSLLAAVAVLLAAQQGLAQAVPTEDMESRLREVVVNAVMSEPALRGVWVVVLPKTEKGFELDLRVDSQPQVEKSQLEEMKRVVKSVVKAVPFKLKVVDRLPFRQFVKELQLDIELSAELAGTAVEDAYYTAESGSDNVVVVLMGRVLNDAQREPLVELSNQRIKKLFAGANSEIPLTKTNTEGGDGVVKDGVVVITPSNAVAQLCFGLGMQKFTHGHYAEAYQTFTTAHLDAPRRTDIQYWRVVSLIGCGRDPDARRLLEGLVKVGRQSGNVPKEAFVFKSLEQVQGPLRWKLIALENSLFCKNCD